VVARVVESLQAQDGARETRFDIGDLPAVLGDEQQLGQLFQNLIGNAVKFVPDERVAEVRIAAERDGYWWRFTIADNGIGIDPAHADRIFRMFQRLHTRDDYPGTGIGLAIAKKVVERHGGEIWAGSRNGGGRGAARMMQRTILLVEDHAGDVRLTREADVAVELVAVSDGEQALAYLPAPASTRAPSGPTSSSSTSTCPRRTGSRCSRRSAATPTCAACR
jgi:hypothetical protein